MTKQAVALLVNEPLDENDRKYVGEVKAMLETVGCEVIIQNEKEYFARGRVADCTCQMLECVCALTRLHLVSCRYRKALIRPIAISCEEHGVDVCPVCDSCTCGLPATAPVATLMG